MPKQAKRPRQAPKGTAAPPPLNLAGMGSLLSKRAGCCNPRPGQPVVGYITVGKGISVHRADCSHVRRHRGSGRLISVEWDG